MTGASRWLAGASYLQKWLVLGVLIGSMAGVGAIVFYEALLACTHFFLGTLAGYSVPTPAGEGGHRASATFARPWAIPGTPELMHRIGGLEKADGPGTVSYDPANHERMTKLRVAKVAGIAADIPAAEVDDPDGIGGAEVLVTKAGAGSLSVGTTPLAIKEAKPLPASD